MTNKNECNHKWIEKNIKDKNFGVIFGIERICKICGKKQYCDFCEGRTGGSWRNIENDK